MSKEKKVKLLIELDEGNYEHIKNGCFDYWSAEALYNAIANGTPYNLTDDLIGREYVESIVKAEVVDPQDGTEEWRSYVNDTCENILIKVHNATTVDLWQIRREATENALKKAEEMYKRPKGKWIGDCYNPECDQCHTKPLEVFCDSLGLDGESYVSIPMTFCPSCGAYMRRGEEENE